MAVIAFRHLPSGQHQYDPMPHKGGDLTITILPYLVPSGACEGRKLLPRWGFPTLSGLNRSINIFKSRLETTGNKLAGRPGENPGIVEVPL